eukprot:10745696-Alexandrium_andersonii.AAC.1
MTRVAARPRPGNPCARAGVAAARQAAVASPWGSTPGPAAVPSRGPEPFQDPSAPRRLSRHNWR